MRRLFWEGLITWGNLRFKIDWASLVVGRKFTLFALFYFVCDGSFLIQAPPGGGGDLMEGFLRYEFGEVLIEGAYRWRGLF